MFKIINKTFHVSRGDSGVINLSLKNTNFNTGDKVFFRIYEVQGLDSLPIKEVSTTVSEENNAVAIVLNAEDTNFGELENTVVDYWYEISVGEDRTILGFDESGAKIFKLYPTGATSADIVD